MNTPSNMESEKRESLVDMFRNERNRIFDIAKEGKSIKDFPKPSIDPVTEEEFLKECMVLPKDAMDKVKTLDSENLPRNLEHRFKRGTTFCLLITPFMEGGYAKENINKKEWDDFIQRKGYLTWMNVDPLQDNLTIIPSETRNGYFYDIFPETVKKDIREGGCSFNLDYPEPDGDWENKMWFVDQYSAALENLKSFMAKRYPQKDGSENK